MVYFLRSERGACGIAMKTGSLVLAYLCDWDETYGFSRHGERGLKALEI